TRSAAIALLALSLLAAGCGENAHYSASEVRAAFEAVGITFSDSRVDPGQVLGPERVKPPPARPLPAIVNGLRSAFRVPTLRLPPPETVLTGRVATVYVYAREDDARRREQELSDRLAAERILGRPSQFGVIW